MKRNVLVAVAVILVIGGIWLWRRDPGHTKPTTGGASSGSAVVPAPVSERGDPSASAGAGGDAPLLIDDDPRGSLRLEGQVVDDDNEGVAGAIVVVSSNPERTTKTEADGSFGFDELVARPYTLVARADPGVAGPITARLTSKSDPVILHLRPGSKVEATVVGPDAAPIAGATVELRGNDTQSQTSAAPAGQATFATVVPGGYDVVAWAPGFAKSYQFAQVAGAVVKIRVALRAGAPVSGRVVTERGDPVANANVVYYGASDWSTQADERRDAATTDAAGKFSFEALGAGSVRFVARHPDFAPGTSAIITLDGKSARDNVEVAVAIGARVSGRVVDDQGQPVESARVRVGVESRGMLADSPRQAFTDQKGEFAIAGLPRRALQAVAMHETGASATVPVDATVGDVAGLA